MSDHKRSSGICFIDGDARQYYAALEIAVGGKFDVFVSGDTFCKGVGRDNGSRLIFEENPLRALRASKAVVLPLPAAKVEETVPFSEIVNEMKNKNGIVVGGKLSPYMLDVLEKEKIKYYDYYNDESFTIKNAYITAEGAMWLAMNALDVMLRDARCAILGFGRIGSALGRMLLSIGCRPLVYARRAEVRAIVDEMGMISTNELSLENADVIFNTVPERIISNDMLLELSPGRILVELASLPGGFDPDIAAQCSHTVIYGNALPGKYAPKSAGKAVVKAITPILNHL